MVEHNCLLSSGQAAHIIKTVVNEGYSIQAIVVKVANLVWSRKNVRAIPELI